MSLDITAVTPADLPDLCRLGAETFCETFAHLYPPEDLADFLDRSYSPEAMGAQVANPRHFWLLVRDKGQAVAYLQCGPVTLPHPHARPVHDGEIKRLYVRESHQGRGLGRELMRRAIEHLETAYTGSAQWIGVWCNNLKAQALYGAFGFVKVGEYQFPVGNTLDDEFILRRLLPVKDAAK